MTLAPRAPLPRKPYRPPIGIPTPRENRAGSVIASVVLHAIIIFLIIGPVIAHDIIAANEGAGGKGPAGGGGGGQGFKQEQTTYIEIAPPPPAVRPPVPQVVPPPVVTPPEPQVTPPPTPDPIPISAVEPPTAASGVGTTGGDGSGGRGPGTGGGVGSGQGTGTGSSIGPGTGGGSGRVYPPTVTHLAMLPLPVPSRVRPYTLVAVFEVDETGKARLLHFNETKDRDYNRKIRAMLAEIRFRPAVRADGTPVRDTAQVVAEARL